MEQKFQEIELFKKKYFHFFYTQRPCEVSESTQLSILGIFFPVFSGTFHIPESSYVIFLLIESRLKC